MTAGSYMKARASVIILRSVDVRLFLQSTSSKIISPRRKFSLVASSTSKT
eukprot:CAMPEP_0171223342 /NCGR_PEP_ID=MMETSP0790-20130122/35728_1 /TAXON_ID=2925 /ORGANISM="Alexandrium catenella, Strain OF101" /LENGTH=49 /DNA_ID= /DNA_START= /DNA_END= /DNA_ORIENTATION=